MSGVIDEKERARMRAQAKERKDRFLKEHGLDDLDELDEAEIEEEIQSVKDQAAVKKKGEWKDVEPEMPNIWRPTESGSILIGTITEINEGEYGLFAVITTRAGDEVQTPAHTYLQSRLKNCAEGDVVKIVYKGLVKVSSGRTAGDYAVYKYVPLEA